MKRLLLCLLLAATPSGNPACPREGSDTVWTGKVETAKDPPYELVYEYSCVEWMHKFWSNVAPGTEKER